MPPPKAWSRSPGELDLADLYSDLGDLPVTVWVDRETGYPVRYYIVMTKMMQSILEKTMAAAVESGEANLSGMMTVDQLTVTMDCFNFNNATAFEIPCGGSGSLRQKQKWTRPFKPRPFFIIKSNADCNLKLKDYLWYSLLVSYWGSQVRRRPRRL